MRVLGIDPSSSLCGAALAIDGKLEDTWIWEKNKAKSGPWNIHNYFISLQHYIIEVKPDMACVEFLSVERNAQTTRKVSHFQAASVLACKVREVMVIEARVSSARKEALGRGDMNKDDAFQAMKKMYPSHKFKRKDKGGYDEADAAVLALAAPGLAER